jgi:hypothetical protein
VSVYRLVFVVGGVVSWINWTEQQTASTVCRRFAREGSSRGLSDDSSRIDSALAVSVPEAFGAFGSCGRAATSRSLMHSLKCICNRFEDRVGVEGADRRKHKGSGADMRRAGRN